MLIQILLCEYIIFLRSGEKFRFLLDLERMCSFTRSHCDHMILLYFHEEWMCMFVSWLYKFSGLDYAYAPWDGILICINVNVPLQWLMVLRCVHLWVCVELRFFGFALYWVIYTTNRSKYMKIIVFTIK